MSLEQTLNDMDPGYIIMYHSNVTAIRQIETYEAMKKRQPHYRVKVFFLLHAQTVEEQSYLTNLRREKQAFELLIDTKSVSFFKWLPSFNLIIGFNLLIENGGT